MSKRRKPDDQIWTGYDNWWFIKPDACCGEHKDPYPRKCTRDGCNDPDCLYWHCVGDQGITSWISECKMKSYINVEEGE